VLFEPLELPCGVILRNRIVKSAMSDSLGDGRGNPTEAQARLYERWAAGGVAASLVGEVQCTPHFAEKPGNLVLSQDADRPSFESLARRGSIDGTQLWPQLAHAGAMSHPPISSPKGPSAIDLPGLTCAALTLEEIHAVPSEFAGAAKRAQQLGFGGVQIHAAHGFLLSQFLSPLFNRRGDAYGGSITARMRLLLEVIDAVRDAVDPGFAVTVKLNATDQQVGGFVEDDALSVISALDATGIDLVDVSGGTYFPGATSASDSAGTGPYFVDFAALARRRTSTPLMVTGGFKTRQQAIDALDGGNVDAVGIARALVLDPALVDRWRHAGASARDVDPVFPRFRAPPEGGITAWYTMRLTQLAEDRERDDDTDLAASIEAYDERDRQRVVSWSDRFHAAADASSDPRP